jgi:hypothetical protein
MNHLTEIAYILDRSGSMQSMQEPAVAAFNDFIKIQLDVSGDANLTLIQLEDAYEVPNFTRPIQDSGMVATNGVTFGLSHRQ